MDEGMQVMAVNCYPPCPQPDIAFGLPPHSDYSCLTIILQSSEGLEFLGKEDESWRKVPNVHVGDHLEVLSNGIYKSIVHRATLNRERTRISITSLHSLGVDMKMETARELVDEQLRPHVQYRSNLSHSLEDYLVADRDITGVVVTDRDLEA
ncbi:hypothetical protein WN944_024562 [Citrus x changshan-huyou]|uniref:Fe2OG dioxygenase domain-containing protein n=1 Tax=Citrus x changshan-huyou TaxID=2935761 RepID=A0AAP0LUG7_9ROSI